MTDLFVPENTMILIICGIAVAAILIILVVLFVSRPKDTHTEQMEVETDSKSVVTVRKVAGVTRVSVKLEPEPSYAPFYDEDSRYPTLPPEVTRKEFPALYEEYMDDSVPALRRRDILVELYNMGYALPTVKDLQKRIDEEEQLAEEVRRKALEAEGGLARIDIQAQLRAQSITEIPPIMEEPDVELLPEEVEVPEEGDYEG